MNATLHGGLGLYDEDRAIRYYVNIDGRVWTCVIGQDALGRLAGTTTTGEALFDQFVDHEDAIVAQTQAVIAAGATDEPVVVPADRFV